MICNCVVLGIKTIETGTVAEVVTATTATTAIATTTDVSTISTAFPRKFISYNYYIFWVFAGGNRGSYMGYSSSDRQRADRYNDRNRGYRVSSFPFCTVMFVNMPIHRCGNSNSRTTAVVGGATTAAERTAQEDTTTTTVQEVEEAGVDTSREDGDKINRAGARKVGATRAGASKVTAAAARQDR